MTDQTANRNQGQKGDEMMTHCQQCDEPWAGEGSICEGCQLCNASICTDCGREIDPDERPDGLCEKCERDDDWLAWQEETEKVVAGLAKKHGWDFNAAEYSGGRNTRSRYYELSRSMEDDEGEMWQTLKLRMSDHGSAYCSEDISLAKDPSGDDHSLATLEVVLAEPFREGQH